jgi:hypothetical protein
MIETVEELNSLRLATEQSSHTPAKLSLSEGRKEIPESVLETTRFVDPATDLAPDVSLVDRPPVAVEDLSDGVAVRDLASAVALGTLHDLLGPSNPPRLNWDHRYFALAVRQAYCPTIS